MKVGRFFGRFLASVQIERVFVNPQEPCQSTCVHHRSKSHVHPAHWGQKPKKFALFLKWEFFFSDWNSGRNCSRILYTSPKKYEYSGWHFGYVWTFMARIPFIETRICIRILEAFKNNSKGIQKLLQSKFLNIFFCIWLQLLFW